jgi:mono/diheme cytochrome c family protein
VSWLKKVLIGVGGVLLLAVLGVAIFVYVHTSAFDASLDKVYDVPVPSIQRSTDPAVLARGDHLAHSLVPCAASDCHGKDLGGGKVTEIGPIGTLAAPNITGAGLGAAYSDGELARLLIHGLKKDGRTVQFMASHEFNFISDADVVAVISYIRTLPPVNRPSNPMRIKTLGKILDRLDKIPIDIARRIDHQKIEKAPPPAPTPAYGRHVAKLCTGCHGANLSGGPIPGAPPDMAVPLNLTPHESGIKKWKAEDFAKVMKEGRRLDGRKLDPMMPVEAFGQFDDTEMQALYSYLMTLAPREFGGR